MCKSNVFEAVISAIISETEVSREQMFSHTKQADVVEARRLLYYYLRRCGFYPSQIARMTNQSRQCVNTQLQVFDDTCQYSGNILKIYRKRIDKVLEEYLL